MCSSFEKTVFHLVAKKRECDPMNTKYHAACKDEYRILEKKSNSQLTYFTKRNRYKTPRPTVGRCEKKNETFQRYRATGFPKLISHLRIRVALPPSRQTCHDKRYTSTSGEKGCIAWRKNNPRATQSKTLARLWQKNQKFGDKFMKGVRKTGEKKLEPVGGGRQN